MTNSRRFPAEWEKQQGILLCFPHNGNDWPGKYEAIQWAFVEFIKKVSKFEEVVLVVADEKLKAKVIGMLEIAEVNIKAVSFIIHKTNRSWMRDSGPIIVKNGRYPINLLITSWSRKLIVLIQIMYSVWVKMEIILIFSHAYQYVSLAMVRLDLIFLKLILKSSLVASKQLIQRK